MKHASDCVFQWVRILHRCFLCFYPQCAWIEKNKQSKNRNTGILLQKRKKARSEKAAHDIELICFLTDKQSYQLYDEAYQQHLAAPNTLTLAAYVELHNNYVQDVHAANAMADQFHNVILPQLIQVCTFGQYSSNRVPCLIHQLWDWTSLFVLLPPCCIIEQQELECVYVDLSKTMTNTIQQGCEAMSERVSRKSYYLLYT